VRGVRWLVLGAAAGAGVAATTTLAGAQGVPTVGVMASATSVSVTGPVAAGPTRFQVTRQGNGDLSVYFALLNPGVTVQDLRSELERDDRTRGDASLGLVSIQASVSVAGAESPRAVTFTTKPGLTYVVLSERDQEDGGNRVRPRGITTFTTGAASGASAAAPDATVRMRGLRFRGARTLPRRGTIRVTNEDGVAHFALAFPLRRGVNSARLGRALRSNSESAFGRVVAGAPYMVQNLISGGRTANDNEVRFTRAGRYGLVCFVYEHHRLGMYRIVTVR
jgi:hypothetical protein